MENKKVLVVGMARSGIAAAEFLASRGAKVTVNDAKPVDELPGASELHGKGIKVVAGSHPAELFENSDLIIASPGVPLSIDPFSRARRAGIRIISEVELAVQYLKGRLICITGSNGKTTTTTLIGEILRDSGLNVQVGGNIGTPLVSLVDTSSDDGLTVAELSSFQLEAIETLRPYAAVLLNITPDHLDRYDSMEAYSAAKANIFRNQKAGDLAVLNADDDRVYEMRGLTKARVIFFSRMGELKEGVFLSGDQIVYRKDSTDTAVVERRRIPLLGDHNLENVMAAVAVGFFCDVPVESIRSTIQGFSGVEHRLEFVAELGGVSFYNDSKATNVDAAIKSLEAFKGGLIVILGGKDKGSDYSPLAVPVGERCRHAILVGAAAGKIAAALGDACPLHRVPSLQEAVETGFRLAGKGDVVLLAPACASFDMFDSYEHRGRVFKEAVNNLKLGI